MASDDLDYVRPYVADEAETLTITQVYLGLRPYVLIEITDVDDVDDDYGLDLSLRIGGGLTQEDGRDLLKAALEAFPTDALDEA